MIESNFKAPSPLSVTYNGVLSKILFPFLSGGSLLKGIKNRSPNPGLSNTLSYVTVEHLICGLSELRSAIRVKYTPKFEDSVEEMVAKYLSNYFILIIY